LVFVDCQVLEKAKQNAIGVRLLWLIRGWGGKTNCWRRFLWNLVAYLLWFRHCC